jgi:membrane protein DedA with SNARE-associated domain
VEQILGPLSHATVLGASFEHFLGQWGYAGIFVLSFISAMGLPVGAEVAVIYGGVLASGQIPGEEPLNIVAVIVVAVVAELLGDIAGYSIGKFGGRPLFDRFCKFLLLTHKDLDRAEAWFARRGEPFALFGRFIPLLRSFVSFACGLGEMAFGKFMLYTFIGSAIWATGQAFLGYSLGASYEHVLKAFNSAGYVLGGLFVLAVIVALVYRFREYRKQTAEQASGPVRR